MFLNIWFSSCLCFLLTTCRLASVLGPTRTA
jgi:hypothetical protein